MNIHHPPVRDSNFYVGLRSVELHLYRDHDLVLRTVDMIRVLLNEFSEIGRTFKQGNWAVKLSFFLFGVGNLFYGQTMRGLLFLLFELIFTFPSLFLIA